MSRFAGRTRWVRRLAVLALGVIVFVQHAVSGGLPGGQLCVHADGRLCIEALSGACCEVPITPAAPADCADCDSNQDPAGELPAAPEAALGSCDCTDIALHIIPLHAPAHMPPPATPVVMVIGHLLWKPRPAPITATHHGPSAPDSLSKRLSTVVLRC